MHVKNRRNALQQSWVDIIVDHVLSVSTPVCSQPYFFAQQSSGNYSGVCERQKYGELWINGHHMDLVSFCWFFFFSFKIKNGFVATALLKMVAFAATPWTKYLREANTIGHCWTHYPVNRATGVVSSVYALPAECRWDSCPFLVVLWINGTFLFCCSTS